MRSIAELTLAVETGDVEDWATPLFLSGSMPLTCRPGGC